MNSVPFSYRADPAVPSFADDRPIVVFDGHCVLCAGFARFLLRHDSRRLVRLLPAQTHLGRAIYHHYGLDPIKFKTNLLIADGRVWAKSAGTIRIFALLGFPWSACQVLRLFPTGWLDRLYDAIARNRFRWFGYRATCLLVDPGFEDRFLR
ncbi:MAG: DCC1-like thiol-disulfide oxidoreductase family protein [Pseudomonadota bacterium]|nr:DCC1-like thiol-disulfide oxidoreductase family protein [Pseudomonadota bacterium]